MPQFIEADVIQKIATPAEWATLLGTKIPYKGQIMLVSDGTGKVINIKVGDGTNNFASLEYMFDTIQANVNYVQVTSTSLPTPSITSGFSVVGEGTYTRDGQANVVVPTGSLGILGWNGTVWSLSQSVVLPTAIANGKVNINDINSVSGSEVYQSVFSENISLGTLTEEYINASGVLGANTGFNASAIIPVQMGDKFRYYGKVTTVGDNQPSVAYAVAGYSSSGSWQSPMLGGNNVNEYADFTINNSNITSIRACSRKGYTFKIIKLFDNKVPSTKLETTDLVTPTGKKVTTEKAVNDFVVGKNYVPKGDIYNENLVLTLVPDKYINASGIVGDNSGFDTTTPIPVKIGDIFEYEGKVTAVGSNTPGAAYAVAGYSSSGAWYGPMLLGNDINDKGTFTITTSQITTIRASSRKGYTLKLKKVGTKIAQSNVDGLTEISKNVTDLLVQLKLGLSWCAVGDSITFADDPGVFSGYQTFVKNKINFNGYRKFALAGRGWADDATVGSLWKGMQDTATPITQDIVTLFAGTNDFRLNHPLGTFDDYLNDTGSVTVAGALRKVIDYLNSQNPNVRIIIFTPLRRNNSGYTSFSKNTLGWGLHELRDLYIKIAEREALPILDLFMISGITDRNIGVYLGDGLHPLESGHKLISEKIISIIKYLYTPAT